MKYDIALLKQYRQQVALSTPPSPVKLSHALLRVGTKLLGKIRGLSLVNQYTAFFDLSEYNSFSQLDFDQMKDNGVACVVLRSSSGADYEDAMVEKFFAAARTSGMIVGLYHWFDPTDNLSAQELFFAKIIDKLKPDFLALDVEQWWSSWPLWESALAGKTPWANVPHVSGNQISVQAKAFRDWLVARYPKLKTLIYTGTWFLAPEYSPQLNSWLGTAWVWIAWYVTSIPNQTWARFWSWLRGLGSPGLPSSVSVETAWQCSSSVVLANTWERKDTSRFHGTLADLQVFFGITPGPGPGPEPVHDRYYVVPSWLTVRAGPSTTYKAVGYLEGKGEGVVTIVTEYEEAITNGADWIRIDPNAQMWVAEASLAPV